MNRVDQVRIYAVNMGFHRPHSTIGKRSMGHGRISAQATQGAGGGKPKAETDVCRRSSGHPDA